MTLRVGFIGLGEAGSTLAAAMRVRGVEVEAYDLAAEKVTAAGIPFRAIPDLVSRSEYLFSTVTTEHAKQAAGSCRPYLSSGKLYVDLNSTSPSVKADLDALITPTGAHFVEGAILGAVGVTGAATRILTGGPHGESAARALTAAGLNVSFYSAEIGKASTFKMLRGIFSKGMEALILEFLIAGLRAGIEKDLWADVTDFMSGNPFERVAENWGQGHATAYERRYHEMVQVTETMREIGIEPLMTAATETFFRRSCELDLKQAFPLKPSSMEEVAAYMEHRLRRLK
jgi:3-hydroxyisobutyrate dehydrogenase